MGTISWNGSKSIRALGEKMPEAEKVFLNARNLS